MPTSEEKTSPINIVADDDKYKSIFTVKDTVNFTNFTIDYSIEEIEVIINNQIALFKLTGKLFRLISIRLDESPAQQKLITINQLRNSVRLSVDKKDKICVIGNKVLILSLNESQDAVPELIAKIKSNLTDNDSKLVRALSEVISIYSVVVDETVKDAKSMIESVLNIQRLDLEKTQ
ncbi:MAG: hypothetical protein P8X73_15630 [Ignavibacteriaceae bacterium]